MGRSSMKGKLILEMRSPASASIVELYLMFLSTQIDLMMLHFSFVFCSLTGKPHLRWHCSIQKALYHKFQLTASIGISSVNYYWMFCTCDLMMLCLFITCMCHLVFILLCLCMYYKPHSFKTENITIILLKWFWCPWKTGTQRLTFRFMTVFGSKNSSTSFKVGPDYQSLKPSKKPAVYRPGMGHLPQ